MEGKFQNLFNNPTHVEEVPPDGWGGMGGYMRVRSSKQQEQFQQSYKRQSNIFNGVSIWVNGYTEPSSDELRKIMAEHGGRYQYAYYKTNVTHVIATNLPDSKIKNLKRDDKVVHPNWIVDSVKAGRLLSIDKYLLYSVNKREGTILSFNRDGKTPRKSMEYDSGVYSFSMDTSESTMSANERQNSDHNSTATNAPVLSKHEYSKQSTIKSPLKAGNDNFISEFYSNSRLHHLSMWKAELKKFTDSIQKGNKEKHGPVAKKDRLVMHVDLDSFFVSVSLKINPSLKGKPVAVCHSTNNQGSKGSSWSEIASCSYEARQFGCRNGMFLSRAKELCPSLICVPYEFEEYRNVSQKFYEVLASYTYMIEAVSCDEALMDISRLVTEDLDATSLAEKIRSSIFEATGCTASCGIGNSILIARMATKRAKPNGVHQVNVEDIPLFIGEQKIVDLPGIGWAQSKKFESNNLTTCYELQKWSLQRLQKEFGQKHGETLYKFCRGQDERMLKLEHERKSVSAEINYGMRFTKLEEVTKFMGELSHEVEKRLKEIKKKGSQITLKLMIRRKDAGEASKYMGHGICDHFSKSVTLPEPVNDPEIISKNCINILKSQNVPPSDVRGIGIQVTKLCDVTDTSSTRTLMQFAKTVTSRELHERDKLLNAAHDKDNESKGRNGSSSTTTSRLPGIQSFMQPASKENRETRKETISPKALPPLPVIALDSDVARQGSSRSGESEQWDPAVFSELPEDIQRELRQQQSQSFSISNILKKSSTTTVKKNAQKSPPKTVTGKRGRGRPKKIDQKVDSKQCGSILNTMFKTKLVKNPDQTTSVSEPISVEVPGADSGPGFLSPNRIDVGVLDELPEDIRQEIVSTLRKTGHMKRTAYSKKDKSPSKPQPLNRFQDKMSNNDKQTLRPKDTAQQSEFHHPETTSSSKTLTERIESGIPDIVSPSQINQSFLKALPDEMQEEILEDAKHAKRRRLQEQSNARSDNTTVAENKNMSNLDQSVLNGLPDFIREDVLNQPERQMQQLGVLKSNKQVKDSRLSLTKDHPKEMFNDHPAFKPAPKPLTQIMPDFYGASKCDDVKKLLRRWVDESEEDIPLDEDVEEVESYFHRLLESYNMETLFVLLKFLKRILNAKSFDWHSAFNRLHRTSQNEIKRKYSGKLPVEPFGID